MLFTFILCGDFTPTYHKHNYTALRCDCGVGEIRAFTRYDINGWVGGTGLVGWMDGVCIAFLHFSSCLVLHCRRIAL